MRWDAPFDVERRADGSLAGRSFVIFDGSCGFCTWATRRLRAWDTGGRLTFVPSQMLDAADFKRFGTSAQRCAQELQFVDARGRLFGGAAAVNRVLWSLPRARAFGALAALGALPLALAGESAAYRFVARNRTAISRVLNTAKYALFSEDGAPVAMNAAAVPAHKREVVTLTGRVQGVGFRATVLERAASYDVAGTVRNTAAGAVVIDVEGPRKDVEGFIGAVLADPPPDARVERVQRDDAQPRGARGFHATA